jgi:tRNA (mo5U34)-methyltransferase
MIGRESHPMMDRALALELVQGIPWHHDFEIIPGVRTHGSYDPSDLWQDLQLPADLTGLTLADIGASNGYFSFTARQRGARVVAFDFRHKDNSGFGLAQHVNGLHDIEHHHVNVLEISADRYGVFDIVLALGLLYHVPDPYRALANCARLSRDRLLIESYCIDSSFPQLAAEPVMRLISDPLKHPQRGQPNDDWSNFWGFTSVCLQHMVEDVGFEVQRTLVRHDRVVIDARRVVSDPRATRFERAYALAPRHETGVNLSDPASWKIF